MIYNYFYKRKIKKGKNFLFSQVLSGKYGLSCYNEVGLPMFSHNKGHLFSTFFISEVFKNDLPEVIRSIFITRILSEQYNGMWGYSSRSHVKGNDQNPFIVDTDDSAFAMRTLRNIDVYHSAEILTSYCHDVDYKNELFSLFSTFKTTKATKIVRISTFEDNLEIHPEVNANIYNFLLETDFDHLISIPFIEKIQNPDGSWPSYFYPNKFYASYQFITLLSRMDPHNAMIEKGCKFIIEHLDKNNFLIDNFSLGLAINCLQLAKNEKYLSIIKKLIKKALKHQNKDGGWYSEAPIWKFTDSENMVWEAKDSNGVITSSLILKALLKNKEALQ